MLVDILIKEQKYDYNVKCNHVSDIVNLREIKTLLKDGFCKSINIVRDNIYYAEKKINPEIWKLILENKEIITEESKYLSENFKSAFFDEIVIYYLVELVILINFKNKTIIDIKTFYKYLTMLDYVPKNYLNSLKHMVFNKRKINRKTFQKNINILITNKNSYEFPRNIKNLKNIKMVDLINNINIPLLEIPANKDTEKNIIFLNDMLKVKNSLNLKKWNFSLRIKKTKKNNDGMYIKNANTIIIDPRSPEAFYHELGHYIYENKLAFTKNEKRYYPCHFKNLAEKFRKDHFDKINIKRSELEDHSDSSEIFAIWFDSILKTH